MSHPRCAGIQEVVLLEGAAGCTFDGPCGFASSWQACQHQNLTLRLALWSKVAPIVNHFLLILKFTKIIIIIIIHKWFLGIDRKKGFINLK